MNRLKLNYDNNLVNLSNSILKHFGVKTFHKTMKDINEVLKKHQKVCVLLYDGLGSYIIRKHLSKNSFMRKHYFKTISSIYPPTTVAATTAFLSARYPIENGWMAWSQYYDKYHCSVEVFKNTDYEYGKKLEEGKETIHLEHFSYESIIDLINKNTKTKAYKIMPNDLDPNGPHDLKEALDAITNSLRSAPSVFTYFYWASPDHEIHTEGTNSRYVNKIIRDLNELTKKLVEMNKDTLFISIADHGLINVEFIDLVVNQEMWQMFYRLPSFESRITTFYIKDEYKNVFPKLFKKLYGQHFILLTKKQVLDNKVFGLGTPHDGATDFIGDFVSFSIDEHSFNIHGYIPKEEMKAAHAGRSEKEELIDLSIYNL